MYTTTSSVQHVGYNGSCYYHIGYIVLSFRIRYFMVNLVENWALPREEVLPQNFDN